MVSLHAKVVNECTQSIYPDQNKEQFSSINSSIFNKEKNAENSFSSKKTESMKLVWYGIVLTESHVCPCRKYFPYLRECISDVIGMVSRVTCLAMKHFPADRNLEVKQKISYYFSCGISYHFVL